MQASIFDIFGSEIHNQQNLQQSASSHVIEGHVSENIKVKSINDGPSKKALADIGNKDKKNKALLDKTKLLAPSNDEENASSNLLTRTPVHKSKIYMQTPNMKPLVRSPLSDLLPKPKLSVSTLQQSIEIVPAEDLELEEIENLINFVGDLDEYIYEDEFTDILPKSVLRTDEEIYRLRHFWKVLKVPFDSPSYEDLAVDVAVENDLVFDASTKIPDSLFMGLLTHLGNFDECIEVQNVQTDYGPFDGQHCLVTVNLSDINLGSLSGSTNLKVFTERNQLQMKMAAITTIQNLQLSYCIPSTCSIKDFEIFLNKYIQNSNIGISGILHMPNGMCQTASGRSLVTEDWIALAILVIIILLSVSSTAYDVIKKDSKKELLTAFSWYSNGKKLFSTKTSGMRLVSMCWVIMGHRYFLVMQAPAINMIYVVDYVQDASKLTVTNATLAVDSFLFFSGLLVSYIFLMHVKKQQKPFNIGLYYIHRYLRLTPPYAVMIMLQATLLRYVSSGPLFNLTVDLYANNCKENWWTNILYINNYVGVENQCIPQSWYLAIDMHLFILSPIILIPLWKLPRKWSLTILGVLICGGLITAFAVSFVEEFPASLFSANPDLVRLQYYPTHTRFTPWLIGIGYGYFFYETKRRNLKLSKLTVFLGWCMSNVAMLGTVHGVYAFYQDFSLQSINEHTTKDDTANIESSMYTTFARSSWALGVAYACAFDYAGPINNLLSWKVFRPLSRLTYCAYLVHASYQVIQTYSTRTPSYISDLNIIQVIGGWMSASVCLLGAVYGILPFQQPDYDYNALESASYNCLHRTVWSFGVSWMIFACVSGYGGPLNSFLSWRAFLPFSRLSYCIYLVHYTFLIYRNFSSRVPAYLNDINVVSLYFGDLFLSILLAAALSLVFEVPIITMEKILLKRGEQQSSQERDTTRNVGITEGGNVNQGFATHNKECKGSTTINIAVH